MSTSQNKRVLGLSRLPLWLSRWLGYRASAPKPEPQLVVYFWSFIASFCTISILQAIFSYASYFRARHVPAVIGSYGASAVLCFDVIGVPFAQPRALVGGHFISALVGICVTRLIEVRHDGQLLWLAGSLSTALAIVAMRFTKTTHPPAGATALLAAVDPNIHALGWYYLPVILLSSIVMLVMALFFNNIQRRYPSFWISPPTLPTPTPAPESMDQISDRPMPVEKVNHILGVHAMDANGGVTDIEKGPSTYQI